MNGLPQPQSFQQEIFQCIAAIELKIDWRFEVRDCVIDGENRRVGVEFCWQWRHVVIVHAIERWPGFAVDGVLRALLLVRLLELWEMCGYDFDSHFRGGFGTIWFDCCSSFVTKLFCL